MNDFNCKLLIELNRDYIETISAIYRLRAVDDKEINKIYKEIKTKIIKTKKMKLCNILEDIKIASVYNNRHFRSYLELFRKIYDKYHPKGFSFKSSLFDYVLHKEYDYIFPVDPKNYFVSQNYTIDVHEKDTIYKAIMNDDINSFIKFTERDGFDVNQTLKSYFYPDPEKDLSLLEICCYHGSVNCFKILRSKFNSEISQRCFQFSFLGGNPDIMNECLKYQAPDQICMKYAIASHNIDFVCFLMDNYDLYIDIRYCSEFNNFQAILIYLDQIIDPLPNDILLIALQYNSPSLCECALSRASYPKWQEQRRMKTPLHIAAENGYKELVELFISHGADVNSIDYDGKTALYYAAENNHKEIIEFLITHDANINATEKSTGRNALHFAAIGNSKDAAETLILNGIDINKMDLGGNTALHMAVLYNSKEMVEFLITHGVDINAQQKYGKTALHIASKNNRKEISEILILNGIDINVEDFYKKTALDYADMHHYKEISDLLVSRGAIINKLNEINSY
ncbi:hypothetical protein TVAG_055180 [Trichomonas vaginalis G3]|uniref:DUF3447 domain-containing protein n=1 Tax=Trichomonas vaginalis (strain ATCC PRA-98 / G3) TaxID=412133 RepID=A2ETI6_TRIV3|nr:protein ubiquitination [Trichomonas vaginalis G3]EAY04032.1 hypothetical protein TVAG_055180 [Trichomonas vaginalis G3]KAI5539004.1 protein ubiquitination [Trichomonas vaginalis G3]|eukprot:XP_001316255.1 hypothetical protein [Trichomonas vaginalis G3]